MYLPSFIPLVFILTTLATLAFLYYASGKQRRVLALSFAWLGLQGAVALSGFYTETSSLPPRFLLLVLPPLIGIALLFASAGGRTWMDQLDGRMLTLLHSVRIPVELVLFWLFIHGAIPQLMTFEGRNFDIVAGLSAPLIYLMVHKRQIWSRKVLLVWNFICLALLLNIVVHAVLSVSTPFQQLAFDQPNIGVLHFPYVWLPGFVVPVVLLAHLVAIRREL